MENVLFGDLTCGDNLELEIHKIETNQLLLIIISLLPIILQQQCNLINIVVFLLLMLILLLLLSNNYRNRNTTKIVTKVQCGGSDHSVIQMNDGKWFVFGANDDGQLGIGNIQNQETPIELPSPFVDNENDSTEYNRFINIFCSVFHNIGITENGDCYGWGCNEEGQLGLDNYKNYSTPTRLKETPLSTTENQVQQQRYIWFSCGPLHTVSLTNLGIVVF